MTRVDLAQEHIQRLERSIAEARAEFADWDEPTLDAYLAPLVGELDSLRQAVDEALTGRVHPNNHLDGALGSAGGLGLDAPAPVP